MFAGVDYSSAFICILAILKTRSGWVGAFPFGSAAGTRGFVFVAPNFKFAAADVAVDVGGFRLQQIAQSRAGVGVFGYGFIRAQLCHLPL